MIVAGHETTAAALTWTWYLIGRHPETAAQLEAEADRTTRDALGLDAAESLAFTHQVVQEALRLYPPGGCSPAAPSRPMNSADLPYRRAPMCSSAPTPCTGTPRSGATPEEFRPERFAGVDAKERHRFAYIPFSVGPRHCIGENMAMFEMLVHVNRMMRRFRLTRLGNESDRARGANQPATALQSHDDK